ncbi:MAG: ABC transporter substrate-binding protein [Chloroflexi bacterium]|nr:ABC transporter substrate-binding protein [Chloroflexota bacterium]MCL5108059.1 ABC transporter substrate-binding protein [Chloroflexota bacterium]
MGSLIHRRVSRRRLLVEAGSAALLATALGACSPISTQPPATQAPAAKPATTEPAKPAGTAAPASAATAAPAPAAGQPKKGGTLRFGKMGDISTKDVHQLGAERYAIVNLAWDTPIRFDPNLKPQPWLAESFEFNKDDTVLTLKVRKGVKFHTGREMTADDFKFNLERVRKPETNTQMRFGSEKIQSMELPDPYTIVLKFAEPNPAIWDTLETLYIVDKENIDNKEFKQGIGTGPFKWLEWRPGERIVFERNPDYWQQGLPYLDRIDVIFNKDVSTLSVNMDAGAADVAEQSLDRDLIRLRDTGRFQAAISDYWSDFYYLGAVVTNAPTNNKKLRQAVNYAIDRQRFVNTALAGIGEAQSIPWPKNSPAYDADQAKFYKYDLEKAKQLVQESGLSNPSFTIVSAPTPSPNWTTLAEMVQADLQKTGVNAKIEVVENAVWRDRLTQRKMQHMWVGQFGFSHMHPSTLATLAFPWRVGANTSQYESPEYADLVKKAAVTADPSAAKKVYTDLTKLILDESFMMTVSPQKRTWLLAPYVKGFAYGVGNYVWLERCWLDK